MRSPPPFTDTADFVAFEGTHLRGGEEIPAFHRQNFATVVKGTGLEGGVRFVRFLATDRAVIHSWVRYTNLPGVNHTTPGRDSMQLYVAPSAPDSGRSTPCRTPAN